MLREAHLPIFKSFICPLFDYSDVIHDQLHNDLFHAKLESYQYKAALAITGTIKESYTGKFYQELGIEHLPSRLCFRKPCLFYKISSNKLPPYLFNLIRSSCRMHTTRNSDNITPFKVKHNSFFEWNKLDLGIPNSDSLEIFKKNSLNFVRPWSSNVFNTNNLFGLKLYARLRIGFSHLKKHKLKHNFQDSVNPSCSCENYIFSLFLSPLPKF